MPTVPLPVDEEKKSEHPQLTILVLGFAASNSMSRGQKKLLEREQNRMSRLYEEVRGHPGVIPSGMAEIFAYRLGQFCDVPIATVRLTTDEPTDFKGFIREVPGGWSNSERIPNSLPVWFLRGRAAIIPDNLKSVGEISFREWFLHSLDKRCPVDREAYSDFPAKPGIAILDASRWNSRARLLGHAFRALLYCSYAHSSNVLVDTGAKLWLIDHEKLLYRETTDDIERLYGLVNKSRIVMDACSQIARLTEEHIHHALSDIPEAFWKPGAGVCGHGEAVDYFARRLAVWKARFSAL